MLSRFSRKPRPTAPSQESPGSAPDVEAEGTPMPKQIARQAPYLRRYARALTGSQAAGDALVQTAMERLLSGEARLDPDVPLRPSLFRVLHQAWLASGAGDTAAAPASGADVRLQTLSPERRACLLLVAMEGFPVTEAAVVLDLTPEACEARLQEAQAEIETQLRTDVLIIEDEPIIALDLTRLVRELGHVVTGVAATHDEAMQFARAARPGLLLADIRLADGSSGMDAASDILRLYDIPVIFITAFPEHLLTGDRPEPAFLITKPFREDAVKALIGQALFFHRPLDRSAVA
jgi:DNA-directed RNA polymerase specialized sigma24 family protein